MRKKGLFLIAAAIVVFIIFIYFSATQKKEANVENNVDVLLTAPPDRIALTKEPEATEIPNREEIGEENENLSTEIEILDLPREAWNILDVSKERLAGEVKIYLNSAGYATADAVHYAGEITIDHMKNIVIVGFYIKQEGIHQFNLTYDRAKKTYSFEQW